MRVEVRSAQKSGRSLHSVDITRARIANVREELIAMTYFEKQKTAVKG